MGIIGKKLRSCIDKIFGFEDDVMYIFNEEGLNMYSEYIQKYLDEDARKTEDFIRKNGAAYFSWKHDLTIKFDNPICQFSRAELSRKMRVKCLLKNIKIPFTYANDGQYEKIMYIYNIEHSNTSS